MTPERQRPIPGSMEPDALAWFTRSLRQFNPEFLTFRLDLTTFDDAKIGQLLATLCVPDDAPIDVIWLRSSDGMRVTWFDIRTELSRFWGPGRDDIAVVPVDHTFLLHLDHEEQLLIAGTHGRAGRLAEMLY